MAFGHKCFVKRGIEFQTQGRPPDASYPSYSCLKNLRVCGSGAMSVRFCVSLWLLMGPEVFLETDSVNFSRHTHNTD